MLSEPGRAFNASPGSFDGHPGNAFQTLTYIDPAVTGNVLKNRDPALDIFSAVIGYSAATDAATYTSAFVKKYTAAQAIRKHGPAERTWNFMAEWLTGNAPGTSLPRF